MRSHATQMFSSPSREVREAGREGKEYRVAVPWRPYSTTSSTRSATNAEAAIRIR